MHITEQSPALQQFEQRKKDHIQLALQADNEARGGSGLDAIQLQHEALPDVDFDAISLQTEALGQTMATPFCVASMTAGHQDAERINQILAEACQQHGWLMGVGSQRRELTDPNAHIAWKKLRKKVPHVKLLGNIGIAQLITTPLENIRRLIEPLEAVGIFVHTNPLQESIQPEGTPQFKGCLQALERLCSQLEVPVILKETGCGFSQKTLQRLIHTGLYAVDVSGFGGTHWGRIEGQRASEKTVQHHAAHTFRNWGISTAASMLHAHQQPLPYQIWASGGVRSGLDAAKLLAMGAQIVSFARPILVAALEESKKLHLLMETLAYELKVALFCTGHAHIRALQEGQVWTDAYHQ